MFTPTTFGKYYLYEKLAIGGMAEIYKAKVFGIHGFQKTLVVKKILPEYAGDGEFVKMFIDEANIAVSLTHGNIVPIYELGEIDHCFYIAMEFVDGENLETILEEASKQRRPLPIHLMVSIVIELCKGLDYAHKKQGPDGKPLGIVHRDISPQNVMVSFDGEVKIVDFGIAKAASKLSATRVGTLKGKFGYMSPEQAFGGEIDARTDVYAAGIVLYETLTGRNLFEGENDLELLRRVRAGVSASPRSLNPDVPPELERIVMKALAKEAGQRYADAAQFQVDLSRWLFSRAVAPGEETLSGLMRSLFPRTRHTERTPDPKGFEPTQPPPSPKPRREVSFAQSPAVRDLATSQATVAIPSMQADAPTGKVFLRSPDEKPTETKSGEVTLEAEGPFGDDRTRATKRPTRGVGDPASSPPDLAAAVTATTPVPLRAPDLPAGSAEVATATARSKEPGAADAAPVEAAVPATRPRESGAVEAPTLRPREAGPAKPARGASDPRGPAPRGGAEPRASPAGGGLAGLVPVLALAAAAVLAYVASGALLPKRTPQDGASRTANRKGPPGRPMATSPRLTAATAEPSAADRAAVAAAEPEPPARPLAPAVDPGAPPRVPPVPPPETAGASRPRSVAVAERPSAARPAVTPASAVRPASATRPVEAFGTISVNASPWGVVHVDGVKVKNTPLLSHRLKAGRHTIVVSNPELKRSETRVIEVRANVDEEPILVRFE